MKQSDEIQQIMTSEVHVKAHLSENGCLETVKTTVSINVGWPKSSEAALKAEFGEMIVKKASAAWNILVAQVTYINAQSKPFFCSR